ncbi:PAS domain S-box protein [Paenibacillus xanthanilyticus]|uniref:PAS domain S-box protein n=1 Tax=Paenibacillus xanthanilyticus TaxID=1783531 RepID=A0ABV8K7U3_9BACL
MLAEQADLCEQGQFIIECRERTGSKKFVEVFTINKHIGDQIFVYGTMIDITGSIHSQAELSLSEQRYRSLFEYNSNLIYSFDLQGKFDSMNPMVTKTLGYSFEELIHVDFKTFIYPDDLPHTMSNFMDVIKYGEHRAYETRVIHKSGEIRHAHIINLPIYVDNQIIGVYGIAQDITDSKRYLAEIKNLAYKDHLTGFPNRRRFEETYQDYISTGTPVVVAIVDLDGFKIVNDLSNP